MVAPVRRPGAGPAGGRGAAAEPGRAHRRPAHHGVARAARHRRQRAVSATAAGQRAGAARRQTAAATAAARRSGSGGLAFDLAWELDFWGKFKRGIESADAAYFASIAQYDDVQVLVAAQAASLYASIRTTELRLRIANENAAIQQRSLEITERLFRSGNESELDVQQARSQYLGTLATIPEIESSLRQTQQRAVRAARPTARARCPSCRAGARRFPKRGSR